MVSKRGLRYFQMGVRGRMTGEAIRELPPLSSQSVLAASPVLLVFTGLLSSVEIVAVSYLLALPGADLRSFRCLRLVCPSLASISVLDSRCQFLQQFLQRPKRRSKLPCTFTFFQFTRSSPSINQLELTTGAPWSATAGAAVYSICGRRIRLLQHPKRE